MESILPDSEKSFFVGKALVYGLPIYIDTTNGTGILEVLKKMSMFLDGFSYWYSGDPIFDRSDMRQEAYAAAIEGIRHYKTEYSAQLSTFLHKHVLNRMIDLKKNKKILHANETDEDGDIFSRAVDLDKIIDINRKMNKLDKKWSNIIYRMFVEGEHIKDIAQEENMSPWGLTRALRKKINLTKKLNFD